MKPGQTTQPPNQPLSEQAYHQLRQMIITLKFSPGDVLREDDLQTRLGIGRTPIREALQRLGREHFVQIIPRRGVIVGGIDIGELSTLLETRAVLEPYAARLAAARGNLSHWEAMESLLSAGSTSHASPSELLGVDRQCHEIMWDAADNRFLRDPLDMLYAQSDRLWHLYLSDVTDMGHAVSEHLAICDALRAGDGDKVADLTEQHIRSFDERIRQAVTEHLSPPLAG